MLLHQWEFHTGSHGLLFVLHLLLVGWGVHTGVHQLADRAPYGRVLHRVFLVETVVYIHVLLILLVSMVNVSGILLWKAALPRISLLEARV